MSSNSKNKRIGELCICTFISTTKPERKVEKQRTKQEQDYVEQLLRHIILETLGPNMAFTN